LLLAFLFIVYSCSDDSSSENPEMVNTIAISSIIEGQIIDAALKIDATINGSGSRVEVFIDDQSIYSSQNTINFSINFDPEGYETGTHLLKVVLTDENGKTTTKELSFEINRRLVTINLPQNMLSQYVINAVVFASRMDGSLLSVKSFTNADDKVTLSTRQEFDHDEEFMLTFVLTDNGKATSLSTHANLTRNNLGTINLTKPFRGMEGETLTFPTRGFNEEEFVFSDNINEPFNSDYRLEMNFNSELFKVVLIEDVDGDSYEPEIFYMFGYNNSGMFNNYQYLMLSPPLADDFVLDKADFVTEGLESHSISFSSILGLTDSQLFMKLYGYYNVKEFEINNYHLINNIRGSVSNGDQLDYALNTNFYEYRYWLNIDNYYAAGTGIPKENYTIPDNTLDYEFTDNVVNFLIAGTDHIIGRIRLFDLDRVSTTPNYLWDITFNSKTTDKIVIPALPNELENSGLLDLYRDNLIKVSSTELVKYGGVSDYNEYLHKVIKNHEDPLRITDGQELIYKGNSPFHDGPIRDFLFQ